MNTEEAVASTVELINSQKEILKILWGVLITIGSSLTAAIVFLFKLYVDQNKESLEKEKEIYKTMSLFSERTDVLNETLKETNKLVQENLNITNHPIITMLEKLTKNQNNDRSN